MNHTSKAQDGTWSLHEKIVSGTGMIVLLVGFYIALQLVGTVWGLFTDQTLIREFTAEVEASSHLNEVVERIVKPFAPDAVGNSTPTENSSEAPATEESQQAIKSLNISYFAAWILSVLLLGLIGHVATLTLSTGAKLLQAGAPRAPSATKEDIKEAIAELAKEIKKSSVETDPS